MEGREHRNTGTFEGKMAETSSSTTVSTKLERIAKLAREMPQAALTTLAHHIDIDWLREAYRRTRKDGATGVDRQTAEEYARNLEDNLRSLLERAKSGSYVAPPVRRVHIPKGEWLANAAHRHPNLRGQGAAARGRHGAGGCLRAEFSGLLVRLPARAFGASGAASRAEPVDEDGGRVGP